MRTLAIVLMQAATPSSFLRRAAALAAGILLGLGAIASCSSEGAATDCSLDECTVTFDRGVEAEASLLGVDAKLIGVDGDRVIVEVSGERLSLTADQPAAEVAGLSVSLASVDDQHIALRIGRNGN